MARDLMDDTYYRSSGGQIPVKWTAPEVSKIFIHNKTCYCIMTYTPACDYDCVIRMYEFG